MSWTEERIELLTKLWESGVSAGQIAEELGGVSRNAVIGKAHRMGLKVRPSPIASQEKADKTDKAPKASPPPPPEPETVAEPVVTAAPETPSQPLPGATGAMPRIVSIGPGGFMRQGPGDQQAPIPPAPPRRLVPAKPSAEMSDKTSLLDLNDRICRWPIGHPGEPDFHFCGDKVNPGFPYCVDHCGRAFQAQLPRGHRRPPPPLPFGGTRVR